MIEDFDNWIENILKKRESTRYVLAEEIYHLRDLIQTLRSQVENEKSESARHEGRSEQRKEEVIELRQKLRDSESTIVFLAHEMARGAK